MHFRELDCKSCNQSGSKFTSSGMEASMLSLKLLVVSLVGWSGNNLEGVVLDVTASWCGPCQRMSPIVSNLERHGYPIHKVDFDTNPDLVKRFNVTSIPAFI